MAQHGIPRCCICRPPLSPKQCVPGRSEQRALLTPATPSVSASVHLQLRDLYGPLLACVTATKSSYDAMVRQHSPDGTRDGFQAAIAAHPDGPEARAYRQWMTSVLQPLNERAAGTASSTPSLACISITPARAANSSHSYKANTAQHKASLRIHCGSLCFPRVAFLAQPWSKGVSVSWMAMPWSQKCCSWSPTCLHPGSFLSGRNGTGICAHTGSQVQTGV